MGAAGSSTASKSVPLAISILPFHFSHDRGFTLSLLRTRGPRCPSLLSAPKRFSLIAGSTRSVSDELASKPSTSNSSSQQLKASSNAGETHSFKTISRERRLLGSTNTPKRHATPCLHVKDRIPSVGDPDRHASASPPHHGFTSSADPQPSQLYHGHPSISFCWKGLLEVPWFRQPPAFGPPR